MFLFKCYIINLVDDMLILKVVKMNLIKDIDELFKNELRIIKEEYPILPIIIENFDVYPNNFYNYLNFIEKTVPLCPLKVKYSKELSKKLEENFIDEKHKNYLKNIQNKIEKGNSIFHFQSKHIFKKDSCFDAYKINHLHVGKELSETKYVNSDYVLFFIYYKKVVYFVDITKHPHREEWYKKDGFKIIKNNWKEIADFYTMPNVTSTYNFSLKQEYELSKLKGLIFLNTVDENTSLIPRQIGSYEIKLLNQLIDYVTNGERWDNTKKYYYVLGLTKNTLCLATYEYNRKPLEIHIPRIDNYYRYTNFYPL